MHSSSQIDRANGQWKSVFAVNQYMYCHPDTTIVRRGRPKVLRWQHLVGAHDLFLSVNACTSRCSAIDSIGLHYRHHTFERLQPLARIINSHHLVVSWLDTWVGFKWTTHRGNTQFQVRLNGEDVEHLLRLLQQSGCCIEHKRIELLSTQNPCGTAYGTVEEDADATLSNEVYPNSQGRWKSSQLQESSQVMSPAISQTPPSFSSHDAIYCSQRDSPYDQFLMQESQTQVSAVASQSSGRFSGLSKLVSYEVSSISQSSRSSSQSADLAADQTVTPLGSKKAILELIRENRSIQLRLESYAYADMQRPTSSWNQGSKWYHVGLVSNLFLNLVNPCSASKEPLALLTRGSNVLAEFIPNSGCLRAYYGEGILGLRQRTAPSDSTSAHVQLHMKPETVETACQWLAHWGVRVECPNDPVLPTESTHFNSGWDLRPWSLASSTSQARPCSGGSGYRPY